MKLYAVVPAAGEGSRLGGKTPKLLRKLAGEAIIAHTVRALDAAPSIEGVVVVGGTRIVTAARHAVPTIVGIEERGATRRDTVRIGLISVPRDATHVLVHDAARPLVTVDVIERVAQALEGCDGVVAAIPATDTMKRVAENTITDTLPRDELWRAQTPQGFRLSALVAAHERAAMDQFTATDDAAIMEHLGLKTIVVLGDERNIKITTPADLDLAEALFAARRGK